VSGADVRAAMARLVEVLACSEHPYDIEADLRAQKGFDLAGGSIAERTVWSVRHKLRSVTIFGASALGRAVARAACALLGVPVTFVTSPA
jgi:hypothetical protein